MLVNLTPHALTLRNPTGEDTVVQPSGTVARVSVAPGQPETVPGLPVPVVSADRVNGVEGLPDPQEGVLLVVSGFVGAAVKGTRPDVLVPGTGPKDGVVRNEKGHVVAVTCLKRV
jgi:hypothetical protein